MFRKNMTDCALMVWPSANFQPFMLMVTVLLPLLKTGIFAGESVGCTTVVLPGTEPVDGSEHHHTGTA